MESCAVVHRSLAIVIASTIRSRCVEFVHHQVAFLNKNVQFLITCFHSSLVSNLCEVLRTHTCWFLSPSFAYLLNHLCHGGRYQLLNHYSLSSARFLTPWGQVEAAVSASSVQELIFCEAFWVTASYVFDRVDRLNLYILLSLNLYLQWTLECTSQ